MPQLITDGKGGKIQYLFAHGAGAPMDSAWMNRVTALFVKSGVEVVRFEFPYMAARREGTRRAPDREATLLATWKKIIEERRDKRPMFIGGKSMGGRMATMVADETKPDGVICFGYPFHPPGNPSKLRIAHLQEVSTPILILQGTRDTFGNRDEVSQFELSKKVRIVWMEDGDHSLKPSVRSGRTEAQNLEEAVAEAVKFMSK
jgi:uncharacterized protein